MLATHPHGTTVETCRAFPLHKAADRVHMAVSPPRRSNATFLHSTVRSVRNTVNTRAAARPFFASAMLMAVCGPDGNTVTAEASPVFAAKSERSAKSKKSGKSRKN